MSGGAPPIAAVIGLPPEETVRAFEARDKLRLTNRWSEMMHGEHARAFTVARVAKLDLLATIYASLQPMLNGGMTLEQWKDSIVPELQKAGWWGKVTDRDLTGANHPVVVGPRRLRTIYDTNLRVSRAAGRWARIQELKTSRPFLMYTAIGDGHARRLHSLWGGLEPGQPIRIILPVDHPCWAIYYPPNDWGCRCSVRQLSQRDLDRLGLRVTTDAELQRLGWLSGSGQPGGRMRPFYPAGSKTPTLVPAGIAPGFAYNPGTASMASIADKARRTLETTASADLAAARATLNDLVASDAFLETLTEPSAVFPVMVLDDAARSAIGASARVATLSSATYAKQQARHPELGIAEYRKLPDLGADADIVAIEGDAVLKFARIDGGRWLVAVVKRTASGEGLFVTSYRIQAESSLKRLLSGTTVIYDRR